MMQGTVESPRRAELVEAGRALKEQLAALEAEVEATEDALQSEGQKLPNLSHPEVIMHFVLTSVHPLEGFAEGEYFFAKVGSEGVHGASLQW